MTRKGTLARAGAALAGLLLGSGCGGANAVLPAVRVVPRVDLQRYLGKWFEIARYPNSFQKSCVDSTAEYSLREDGDIRVLNTCRTADQKIKTAEGKAWVVDRSTNAKLKVRFFWPFSGDYWVIDLDPAYSYAVVGDPGRQYLWILAREPRMDPETYKGVCERVRLQGYDPGRLILDQR
jgi:apolipoprotein D and lipocalin family protein